MGNHQPDLTQVFMQSLTEITKSHFEQLEKQSSRQLAILEKQTKNFLDAMTTFTIAMKEHPVQSVSPMPDLLDKTERKNTIEKEEPQEQFLDEIGRIPNILDMKVKLLDEEKFFGEELEN
jgi:uncharacterized protein (DUF885 family)